MGHPRLLNALQSHQSTELAAPGRRRDRVRPVAREHPRGRKGRSRAIRPSFRAGRFAIGGWRIKMLSTPQIIERAPQPYAAIATVVRVDELPAAIDRALPAVFGWLAARGAVPVGAPFFRYRVID